MEAYPAHYVGHNLPFIILFGLETPAETPAETQSADIESRYPGFYKDGFSYTSDLPPVSGPSADGLRQALQDLDARDAAWNSRPGKGKMGSMCFTSKAVGRSLTLPPHKAPPPSTSELEDLPASWQLVLHSPLSPLTPSSGLYPNGILSAMWVAKHQALLPAALACFFTFTVDTSRSSLEDNVLKSQINQLRTWIGETQYAIRLIVVLVCDEPAPVSVVVERLGNIRRATDLDTKTLLYMPGGLSADECRAFAGSMLSSIQPSCIEYYRDLSKHSRRKKNRGSAPTPTIPPTFGTSQTLSARGWNVRYETKLGVFAEFRGEMDAAERNFEQAYEDLMEGDVLEGISSWSPRFNEARMLADVLAIRILRCLLWTNQTTSAAQSWLNHKYRMQDIVDRQGRGSSTYGWQSWEAIWSKVMAQLIEKVEIPFFHVPEPNSDSPLVTPNIFAPAERSVYRDMPVSPWDQLHHPGYWYARTAQRLQSRRLLAAKIPQDDRRAPGESPASALASRSHVYDTYLSLEPHVEYAEAAASTGEHGRSIVDTLEKARIHTEQRHQIRAAAHLRLQLAQELTKRGQWGNATEVLKPLIIGSSWRKEGWLQLLATALLTARTCASALRDSELLLLTQWQLQSRFVSVENKQRSQVAAMIQELKFQQKPQITIDTTTTLPCLSASFTFGTETACVGDPLVGQLTVSSFMHDAAEPVVLSAISLTFKGSVRQVTLTHDQTASNPDESNTALRMALRKVDLVADENAGLPTCEYFGKSDLSTRPGSVNVYQFNIVPWEAQELSVSSVVTSVEDNVYCVAVHAEFDEPVSPLLWWTEDNGSFTKKMLTFHRYHIIDVKPRPPKLQLTFPQLRTTYYTDEKTTLRIRIVNEETEAAQVRLKVRFLSPDLKASIRWSDEDEEHTAMPSETGTILPQRDLELLPASAVKDLAIIVNGLAEMIEMTLDVEAIYTLAENPNTIITRTAQQELLFARPFEAKYESSLGVHPKSWPSYFDLQEESAGEREPTGMMQRSYVTEKLASFVDEPICLEKVELRQVAPEDPTISCLLVPMHNDAQTARIIKPSELLDHRFRVDVRKFDLENRAPTTIQLELHISWRRQLSEMACESNITLIPVSPVVFDFSKPRALASARVQAIQSDPPTLNTSVVHMTYTLENPSDYLLTFSVTIDASEQFAFAGPKSTSVQLVPLSRSEVRFTLLPIVQGMWISPLVRVIDMGFTELLKVYAAEGMKSEKGRCLVWIPEAETA